MIRIVIALLFFFAVYSTELCAQFNRLDSSTSASVDSAVQAHMREKGIVGCSVGLLRAGEVVWLKGYGLRDRDAKLAATEHTLYRTASIAKTFTAIAAIQLVEQGALDLQKNVREYVPEYPEKPQGSITPYRLLCHRSGIRHYEEFDTLAASNYERDHFTYDPVAAIDVFKNGSLLFQPGTAFSYTTFGYNLLGAVIERAGKQPFEEQLRERINRPLDLPYLQAEYNRLRPYPEETRGYHEEHGSIVETPEDIGILFKVPGGGLLTSVVDLTLLMQGLVQYKLFADSTTQNWMCIDHSGGSGFGIGIRTGTHRGQPYIWHNGGQQRTSTIWLCDPATGDGVAITSNTYATATESFALELLDLLRHGTLSGAAYAHIPHSLPAPPLLEPEDDTLISSDSVTFSWLGVQQGFTYVVEFSADSRFTRTMTDSTRALSIIGTQLLPDTRYYWRVRAVNRYLYDGVEGPWSEVRTLRTASTSGVTTHALPRSIELYPNPAHESITIRAEGAARIRDVSMYSLSGACVAIHPALHSRLVTLPLGDNINRLLYVRIRLDNGDEVFRQLHRQ